jgi:hypothetical protein
VGLTVDGHLPFLHGLEQGALGLRGGPVDLVAEEDVGEHRPGTEDEPRGGAVEHGRARHVGGKQVGGELDALPAEAEGAGQCLGQAGLAHPGYVLDEQVTLGHEADERKARRRPLPVYDPGDVGHDAVEERGEILDTARRRCRLTRHPTSRRTSQQRSGATARERPGALRSERAPAPVDPVDHAAGGHGRCPRPPGPSSGPVGDDGAHRLVGRRARVVAALAPAATPTGALRGVPAPDDVRDRARSPLGRRRTGRVPRMVQTHASSAVGFWPCSRDHQGGPLDQRGNGGHAGAPRPDG